MVLIVKSLDYIPSREFLVLRGDGDVCKYTPNKAKFPTLLHYKDGPRTQNSMFQLTNTDDTPISEGFGTFKLTIPIDSARIPLLSISVEFPEWLKASGEITKLLAAFFPRDNKDFEAHFIRRKYRIGGRSAQYFFSRQISKGFSGLRAYRIASAVVMAYKAIELDDAACQSEALEEVNRHLDNVDECAIEAHPRRNREHLLTSLLIVKWHLELALGRRADFMNTLESCRNYSNTPLTSFFTPAYNLSLSLLMLCIAARLNSDQDTISSVSDECFELFKKAVRDADKRSVLFKELEISHQAAYSCFQIYSNEKPTKDDYESWIRQALRVQGKSATKLIDVLFRKTEPC